jgi:hypothetical protein
MWISTIDIDPAHPALIKVFEADRDCKVAYRRDGVNSLVIVVESSYPMIDHYIFDKSEISLCSCEYFE